MKTCFYCGEYSKVRKIVTSEGNYVFNNFLYGFYLGDYICEKCDKARSILEKENKSKERNEQIKKQIEWKEKRDKILKEVKGGKN